MEPIKNKAIEIEVIFNNVQYVLIENFTEFIKCACVPCKNFSLMRHSPHV